MRNVSCFAVRQIVVTVVRSTLHFSAASGWVNCPVSTDTNISYFCEGANNRPRLAVLLTIEFDCTTILQTCQTRPQTAGHF